MTMFRRHVLTTFVVLFCVAPAQAQDTPVHLNPSGVVRELAALWPCQDSDDEFADQRCREQRPEARRRVRSQVYVSLGMVQLGRFDFRAGAFPITIVGVVPNRADPDDEGTNGAPTNDGSLLVMTRRPGPWRAGEEPGAYLARQSTVAQARIPFASVEAAEAWRETASLEVLLMYRVRGTWRVREQAPAFWRAVGRHWDRGWRRAGMPGPGPGSALSRGTVYEGVTIEVLGWVLIAAGEGLPSSVVASGRPARRAADRATVDRVISSVAEFVRARAGTTVRQAAADPPTVYGYQPDRGDWDCSGEIPAANIQSTVGDGRGAVRACIDQARARNSDLFGTLTVSLRVGPDGAVEAVRAAGGVQDQQLLDCVEGVAIDWRFPAPSGGTCAVIRAPFLLTPEG